MSTACHTSHVISFTLCEQSFWVGTISSFLQLSELRLREIKYHTWDHNAIKWYSWDLNNKLVYWVHDKFGGKIPHFQTGVSKKSNEISPWNLVLRVGVGMGILGNHVPLLLAAKQLSFKMSIFPFRRGLHTPNQCSSIWVPFLGGLVLCSATYVVICYWFHVKWFAL